MKKEERARRRKGKGRARGWERGRARGKGGRRRKRKGDKQRSLLTASHARSIISSCVYRPQYNLMPLLCVCLQPS